MRQVAPKGCPDTHHASTFLRGAPFSRNIKMRRIRRPVSVNPSLTLGSLRSRALKTRVPSIITNSGSNKPASGAFSALPNAVSRTYRCCRMARTASFSFYSTHADSVSFLPAYLTNPTSQPTTKLVEPALGDSQTLSHELLILLNLAHHSCPSQASNLVLLTFQRPPPTHHNGHRYPYPPPLPLGHGSSSFRFHRHINLIRHISNSDHIHGVVSRAFQHDLRGQPRYVSSS